MHETKAHMCKWCVCVQEQVKTQAQALARAKVEADSAQATLAGAQDRALSLVQANEELQEQIKTQAHALAKAKVEADTAQATQAGAQDRALAEVKAEAGAQAQLDAQRLAKAQAETQVHLLKTEKLQRELKGLAADSRADKHALKHSLHDATCRCLRTFTVASMSDPFQALHRTKPCKNGSHALTVVEHFLGEDAVFELVLEPDVEVKCIHVVCRRV